MINLAPTKLLVTNAHGIIVDTDDWSKYPEYHTKLNDKQTFNSMYPELIEHLELYLTQQDYFNLYCKHYKLVHGIECPLNLPDAQEEPEAATEKRTVNSYWDAVEELNKPYNGTVEPKLTPNDELITVRESYGLTPTECAVMFGIPPREYTSWERGSRKTPHDAIKIIHGMVRCYGIEMLKIKEEEQTISPEVQEFIRKYCKK
jgi:DNA-binding transcriptional regulator YiaG